MSQSTDLSEAELQKMLKNNQNYRELAWHMNDHGTGKGRLKMKKKAGLLHMQNMHFVFASPHCNFIGLSIGGLDPSWHREHQDPETFCCRFVAVCIFGHEIRLGPWP